MKRVVAIILTLLYLSSVSGLALNLHYCEGELNCVSLWVKDDCCACPEEEKSGCCSDEGIYIKAFDDSHTAANSTTFTFGAALISSPLSFSIKIGNKLPKRDIRYFCAYDLPPPNRLVLFRTFLI